MEKRDLKPDDGPRVRHVCLARPGAVAVIVLMIVAFASQFSDSFSQKAVRAGSVIMASSSQAGGAANAAVATSRH